MCWMFSRLSSVSIASNEFLAIHFLLASYTFSILYLFLHSSVASSSFLSIALLLKYHRCHVWVSFRGTSVFHRHPRELDPNDLKLVTFLGILLGQDSREKEDVERKNKYLLRTYLKTFYHAYQSSFFFRNWKKKAFLESHFSKSFVRKYLLTTSLFPFARNSGSLACPEH